MFVKNILIIFWFCCPLVNLAKRFFALSCHNLFFLAIYHMKLKAYEKNMIIPIDSECPSQVLAENFYLRASDSFISKTWFPVRTASGFTNKTVFSRARRTLINDFNVVFLGDFCIKKHSVVDKLFRVFPITFPIEGFTACEWKFISSGRYKY